MSRVVHEILPRPAVIRLAEPVADELLGLLTSHGVPHKLFESFPIRNPEAEQIPDELRPVAIKYQRAIASAIRRRNDRLDRESD